MVRQYERARCVALVSAAICVVCLTAGCGSGGPFKYVRVSGKVSYDDGTPIPGGCRLLFRALDATPVGNAYPRPGMALVDANGNFDVVTSYKYGDGLVKGKHKVAIQTANERDDKPVVPKDYASTESTPLVVDTADSPFDIKVPKPKGNR
jgi:hypothetical protein